MSRGPKSVQGIVPRTDTLGYDPRYPDGVPPGPSAPDIVVATPPDVLDISEEAAYSEDFDSYITGADVADISSVDFVEVTGTLTGVDVSAAGTVLSSADPAVGSVTLQIRVNVTGWPTPFTSGNFARSFITPPTPFVDELAPAIPQPPTPVVDGTNVNVGYRWTQDVADADNDASGMDTMTLQRSVDGGAYATRTTLTASGDGLTGRIQQIDIGTPTGGATFSQNGATFTISSPGGSIASGGDNGRFGGVLVSGDFEILGTLQSFTSAQSTSQHGPMVRGSTDQLAPLVAFRRYSSASNRGASMMFRTSQGGTLSGNTATPETSLPSNTPFILRRTKATDTFEGFYLNPTTGQWTSAGSVVAVMDDPVLAMYYGSRQATGDAVTFEVQNFAVNTLGGGTYVDAAALGHTYAYKLRGTDNGANSSSYSAASIIVATAQPPVTNAKKWRPGHGVKTSKNGNESDYWTNVYSQINQYKSNPQLKHIWVALMWGWIETDNNVWDYTKLDELLDWCETNDKYLILDLPYKTFNSNNFTKMAPLDIVGQVYDSGIGAIMPVWNASIMDRYIRFTEHIATHADDHPRLEIVKPSESSPSLTSPFPSGYSNSNLATQIGRWIVAAGNAFQKTNVNACLNSLSGHLSSLMEQAYQNGLGLSTPDAFDDNGHIIFRGETGSGTQGTGVRDYRGLVPSETIASSPVLGGKDNNGPATNVINWAQTNKVTHLSWVMFNPNSQSGSSAAEIQAAIAADPLLHTACPAVYNACDVT